ncbi:unnamed protein product [Rotaria sp. Silwood2]|nr:unnamed protein product [Rotaria sp. Silwood2]CAF2848487.1 unnamed protein product [Rotaria sp. Silwood2]CAF3178096.1 unnamed protein product [Rotaria sp. Silwood2]CAF3188968.1 unnamed protein product [Rotaria sp. Silwood2]CAF3991265.1 unnamed protein product [Rotaria sp. Silwood2]
MLKHTLLVTLLFLDIAQSELTEIITIDQGSLQGIRNSDAEEFLGIQYAKCPERFAPADDPEPWSGIFQATIPAPGCYQNCTSFPSACPANISECCFTLNIYRPHNTTSNDSLAIMVHLYGGSFVEGSVDVPLLNASHLVGLNKNIIVVTCNYRLGAFGFYFNLDDANVSAPGNVALLDQLQCLQWIQNNSRAFGGNPLNVTLWGQSAGASSVGFHLQHYYLNPNQSQLFHQIVVQSWPAAIQPRSLKESKQYNSHLALLVGCLDDETVTECLRCKTAEEILKASDTVKYDITTYYDKLITVGLPWQATLGLSSFFLQFNNIDFINRYASLIKIPILWGTDKDEGTLFIYAAIPQSVPILYPKALTIIGGLWHPENVPAISNLYKLDSLFVLNPTADYHDVLSQILGDYAFTCAMRNMSKALARATNSNIFLYVFDYILKANGTLYGSSHWAPECYTHVCHKSEMPLVFNPTGVSTIKFTNDEEIFAQSIGRYWTNFANTGNPNNRIPTLTSWNTFTTFNNSSLHLTLPASANWNNYRGNPYCDFWDCLGYIF